MALKFNPFTGTLDYVESGETKEKAAGIPTGGGTQTVLMKKSATNYDDEWKLIQNGNIELAANIEEAKLSLPEVIKKTTEQEMTGKKIIRKMNVPDFIQVAGVTADTVVQVEILGENLSWEPAASTFYAVKPTAGSKLQGINIKAVGEAAIQPGTFITIFNEGTNVLLIEDNVLAATATLRIRTHTGGTVELGLKETVSFVYFASRWRQFFTQPIVGEGLELANAKEFKVKAAGITEAMLAEESVGFKKLGFFNDDAPIEIPAGKTYEVPENIQGLWKEKISVQGTLNIQGHFDEVYTIEPESVETAQIRNSAVTEAKAELPEMVKLTGSQTITGEKKINKLKAESITLEGTKELNSVSNATLSGGLFALTEEKLGLGSNTSATLKQLKFSGTVENSTAFEEATQDCAYAVIPEGGAAVLESAKSGQKHRAVFLVNVSTTETLTIVHEGKGTGGNRFHFASGENVKLEPGQTITLWYTEGEASGLVERWRDLSGASLSLRSFTNGIPTEVAAGKTYEVPATIQDLWKDNVSVQGTLNVQGRFEEVGEPEAPVAFLPAPVSETMNIVVPANTQKWFYTETKVEGAVNIQGQLVGIA